MSRKYCKLTKKEIKEIRVFHRIGFLQKELAKWYNSAPKNISLIVRYKTWRPKDMGKKRKGFWYWNAKV